MATPLVAVQRASLAQRSDATLLLNEYYEAVGVVKRDTPEEIATYLSEQAAALWIAYVKGIAAGCVVLRPLAVFNHAAECKRLYVRPRFRGMGLAGTLLDAMEVHALISSYEWIYLDSKDDLFDAIRIYTHRGYTACERYNDNPQATIFLRRRLGRD